jgi:hypothetical protein
MKKLFFFYLTLFSMLANATLVNAQSSLMQFVSTTDGLNAEQSASFTRISNFSHFVPGSTKLVQFNSLQNVVQGDNMTLCPSLPGLEAQCSNLTFVGKHVRYNNEGDFVYYGLFSKEVTSFTECESGELFLNSREGRKFGHVKIDESYFEISAIDANYSVISQVTQESMLSECVGLDLNENKVQDSRNEQSATDRTTGCEIRVLFLFTTSVANAHTSPMIYDKVTGGVSQANTAFRNSLIQNGTVKVAAILPLPVPGFVEGTMMAADLNALIISPAVSAARTAYSADLVCFITNGGASYPLAGLTPTANIPTPMFSSGYFMVEAPYFTMDYTFCHELGHALGCNHQVCGIGPGPGCTPFIAGAINHGFNWNYGFFKNRSTILNQKFEGSTRILHYSNPIVRYGNKPTGSFAANNATTITGTICTVANFYQDPSQQPLSVVIEGEETLCSPNIGHYNALPSQGGAFTYTWYKSANGINWGQPVSTSQSHNLNSAYSSPNATVFLKVVVQDNQGNTALNIFEVSILDPSNSLCPRMNHLSYGTGVTSWVSSNPTKDFIQIGFSLPKSSNIEMSLNNAMGEPVTNIVKFYEAGEHLYPLSLIDYPSGLYFLHGKIGNASFHHKIIRQ